MDTVLKLCFQFFTLMVKTLGVRNANISIATTPTTIAETVYSGKRKLISIVNTSATANLWLSVSGAAALNTGFKLAPGGFWIESSDGENDPSQDLYSLIADGASATIALQERIETDLL